MNYLISILHPMALARRCTFNWWQAVAAIAGVGLSYYQGREAQKAAERQTEYNNEVAMKNYELAKAQAGAQAARIAQQKEIQKKATGVEIERQGYEEEGMRLNQFFRKQDRRDEAMEAQVQAVQKTGQASAIQGASGLRGVSKEAVLEQFAKAAISYEGRLEAEERRDDATTDLLLRDSRLRHEQTLLSINQPLGTVVAPSAPSLQPMPKSGSTQTFMNILSSVTSGLSTYAALGGTFPTSSPSAPISYGSRGATSQGYMPPS